MCAGVMVQEACDMLEQHGRNLVDGATHETTTMPNTCIALLHDILESLQEGTAECYEQQVLRCVALIASPNLFPTWLAAVR